MCSIFDPELPKILQDGKSLLEGILGKIVRVFRIDINYNNKLTRERESFSTENKSSKEYMNLVPSSTLKTITKEQRFTKWAQIKLIIFDEQALKQAYSAFAKLKNIPTNPFEWLYLAAETLSKSQNLYVDYALGKSLAAKYAMPSNPRMVLHYQEKIQLKIDIPFKSSPLLQHSKQPEHLSRFEKAKEARHSRMTQDQLATAAALQKDYYPAHLFDDPEPIPVTFEQKMIY
jgi:hypothetical protein